MVGVSIMVILDLFDFCFLVGSLVLEIVVDSLDKFMVGCELVSCDVIDFRIGEV